MDYDNFTNTIKRYHSRRIMQLSLPESCAPTSIPNAFGILLPNIIEIMQANIEQLCSDEEIIAIFGFQISALAINSDLPRQLDRIINREHPRQHFCCNLSYLPTKPAKSDKIKSWNNAKTIIIDFTSGMVMSSKYYLARILYQDHTGTIYGHLNETLLQQAWKAAIRENK